MNSNQLNWDSVRVFLVVAEHQSLSGAAAQLSVSQPTLGRHISRLEDELNLKLFDRRQTGLFLTDSGRRLLEVAKTMASGAADFSRAVDLEKSGAPDQVCRITTGEWGLYFLSRHAAEIVAGLGDVRLEFYADDSFWDLSRHSADIAIGNRPPSHDHLISQKLGERHFHVYAAKAYLNAHEDATDPATWQDQTWAGYCGTRARLKSSKLLAGLLDERACRYAVNNSVALCELIRSGTAMGILPDWIGEYEDLTRLSAEPIGQSASWLSFHERLRHHDKLHEIKKRIVDLYHRRYHETSQRVAR
ncbi:LysR family transcriptional regulator [Roseibium sp. MMSF_3544]|uniref:LysR family transcriptional regulator n=1 Tax=unclassified Roseibium TaxID=2629323 RepID=UPI00273E1EE2|nr:LysR family transcriptional regulator [Roseibium sp. MMSF_3544]